MIETLRKSLEKQSLDVVGVMFSTLTHYGKLLLKTYCTIQFTPMRKICRVQFKLQVPFQTEVCKSSLLKLSSNQKLAPVLTKFTSRSFMNNLTAFPSNFTDQLKWQLQAQIRLEKVLASPILKYGCSINQYGFNLSIINKCITKSMSS